MRALWTDVLFAALTFAFVTASPHDEEKEHFTILPDELQWKEGPATLPKGAKYVVLEGDPSKEGPFVLRIKMPDGFSIQPHTHPKDERVTVLAGTLYLGMGTKIDEKTAKAMPAGSYGMTKAGMKHFGYMKGETILQLHGSGPWAVEYLNPADDPRNWK